MRNVLYYRSVTNSDFVIFHIDSAIECLFSFYVVNLTNCTIFISLLSLDYQVNLTDKKVKIQKCLLGISHCEKKGI